MIFWICCETDEQTGENNTRKKTGESYLGNIIIDHNNVKNNEVKALP